MKTTLLARQLVGGAGWWRWLGRDGMEQLKKKLRWWMPFAGGVGVRCRVGVTVEGHREARSCSSARLEGVLVRGATSARTALGTLMPGCRRVCLCCACSV